MDINDQEVQSVTDRPINRWLIGARPKTLAAALVPVALGATAAMVGVEAGESIIWWRVVAALTVSLALQVGVNYANDYSDGVRGTDKVRVGPIRLVASGLASAKSVKNAAFIAFGVAVLAGLPLVLTISPWLLIIGMAAIAAAWFYTGGPKPYGYLGLGEVFVFVFFGLVATVGTTYVAIERITALSIVLGCAAGALACAMLVINNLRDMATDRKVGKHTLAVRIGDSATRRLYILLVSVPFLLIALVTINSPWAIITLTVAPLAIQPCRAVLNGAVGKELIGVLGATGRLQLAFGITATAGMALGAWE